MGTGDPHFKSFTGKKFDFQQPGEYLLFASTASGLAVHTYHCPWIGKYVGAVSNVAVVVYAGIHIIEISGNSTYTISGKRTDIGTYELSGGVTAMFDASKFVISGTARGGQRGEVRGYKKQEDKEQIHPLTGFFWNIYGLLPKSHALIADGLCKSKDTCANMYAGNPRVKKAASLFQKDTLAELSKTCSGTCPEGTVPPACKKMESVTSQCERDFCDDPEKLKACRCKESGASITAAKTVCALNSCSTDVDACELDYCMSGGHSDVAPTYKEMQISVCEVECEKCEGTGGTCSSCTYSLSCKPTCTHPPKPQIFPPEKISECRSIGHRSTGDAHLTSFTGQNFEFQQPGEVMFFASTASALVANVWRCPRKSQYVGDVGGVSNIAVAVKVAQYTVQISSKHLTICASSICEQKPEGQYDLAGGVTVTFNALKFAILGPPGIAGQRGEVRGYTKNWNDLTTSSQGFYYNIHGLLPKSNALGVIGMCKSQDTCADMYAANHVVPEPASFFTKSALADMHKMCYGTCAEGTVPPACKPMESLKSQCELDFCDDPEKLKACHCRKSGASIEDARKLCDANACKTNADACELDYCMSGGQGDVGTTYKEMQADVCEVECGKCEETGGTCSSCKDALNKCNPTCTHPPKHRTTHAAGCDSIQNKADCCSSYDGRPLWASNRVPGNWDSSVNTFKDNHTSMSESRDSSMWLPRQRWQTISEPYGGWRLLPRYWWLPRQRWQTIKEWYANLRSGSSWKLVVKHQGPVAMQRCEGSKAGSGAAAES